MRLEKKIKKNTRHADEISRFYVIGIIMIDFFFSIFERFFVYILLKNVSTFFFLLFFLLSSIFCSRFSHDTHVYVVKRLLGIREIPPLLTARSRRARNL